MEGVNENIKGNATTY